MSQNRRQFIATAAAATVAPALPSLPLEPFESEILEYQFIARALVRHYKSGTRASLLRATGQDDLAAVYQAEADAAIESVRSMKPAFPL